MSGLKKKKELWKFEIKSIAGNLWEGMADENRKYRSQDWTKHKEKQEGVETET